MLKVQDWGEDETGEDSLSLGGLRDLPRDFFEFYFKRLMCVFNAFFVKLMSLELWTRFQSFLVTNFRSKRYSLTLEKLFLTKSFSDSHDSACFFDIISPTCPDRFYL